MSSALDVVRANAVALDSALDVDPILDLIGDARVQRRRCVGRLHPLPALDVAEPRRRAVPGMAP